MKSRREKGKKKSYTTGQSGGRKTVRRTEKDGRRQRRMEAVKPVGGPANIIGRTPRRRSEIDRACNQNTSLHVLIFEEEEWDESLYSRPTYFRDSTFAIVTLLHDQP